MTLLLELCCLFGAIGLAPIFLYIGGKIKDPFHPMILIGILGFGVAGWPPLHNPGPALNFVSLWALQEYIVVSILSMLALFAGWMWRRNRTRRTLPVSPPIHIYRMEFDTNRMLLLGLVWALFALLIYIITYHHFRTSGYLRDLAYIRVTAAALLIQALSIDGGLLIPAVLGIAVAVTQDIWHVKNYGGRGSTASLFDLMMVTYFVRGTRPRKIMFLLVLGLAGLTLWSLAASRTVLGKGEASNRITAVYVAASHLMTHQQTQYGAGRTFEVGAEEIEVANQLDNWDNGGIFWNMSVLFLPHEWFPNKVDYYTFWGEQNAVRNMQRYISRLVPNGMAPSGFSSVFIEFHWFFFIVWFLFGYWLQYLYHSAVYERRLEFQGYLVMANIVCLYLVAQDCFAAINNVIFMLLPAYVAYKLCRTRRVRRVFGRPVESASA